jgi:hypothetical protein
VVAHPRSRGGGGRRAARGEGRGRRGSSALVPGVEPATSWQRSSAGSPAMSSARPSRPSACSSCRRCRRQEREDRPAAVRAKALAPTPRPLVARKPRTLEGDRTCRSRLIDSTDKSRSSQAAGEESARVSRASSPSAGARVAVAARSRTSSPGIADELGALAITADCPTGDVERMVRETETVLGPIDLARRQRGNRKRSGRAGRANPDEWWHVLEGNVLGVYLCWPGGPTRDARARQGPDRDHRPAAPPTCPARRTRLLERARPLLPDSARPSRVAEGSPVACLVSAPASSRPR